MQSWKSFGLLLTALLALGVWLSQSALVTWRVATENIAVSTTGRALPAPHMLRLPPDFSIKSEHPRLPVPARFDTTGFPAKPNPHRAMFPDLTATTYTLRQHPHADDLARLYERLMRFERSYRGVEETKSLALAYDWLFELWSPDQRSALLRKTLDACEYQILFIRHEKLSPYNVILYNPVLQSLMTCALAVYPDDPRATPIMAFTYDMWKNRVLPAWRQIMGQHGGWHEGGEYIGIGIGQSVFQLPHLWRHATGEDLFRTEPGLRGHLDFLIHRLQPDGRYVAGGDAAFFDRYSPDAIALALEYRHAAAYWALMSADVRNPTSWPAGPVLDDTLLDMTALARLPLSKLFDGIGTVFARSDWTPDATHLSFKAGNNYWSHSHLDQGAFTIYKGGELAIDSGLYYRAGSDHHMNYTYQSIAHNTLTFTDPDDTVPGPAGLAERDRPRHIANDGGQRRIGSGWGVEEAPLDVDEWQEKHAIYRAGQIEQYYEADGLTVAVADITPAYTNILSGKGEFSARTRRVERFWRVFAYDRISDVVVVFDNTESTQATFEKRWLLHSIEWPWIESAGFVVRNPGNKAREQRGGTLRGWVLWPENASIDAVGGDGQEFWVDGKNYDDRGLATALMRRLPPHKQHPGAWRLEIRPPVARKEDLFLVVMAPTLGETSADLQVTRLAHEGYVGTQIHGAARSVRWWYSPERNAVWIDVVDADGVRRHVVEGTSTRAGRFDLQRLGRWLLGR